MIGQDLSNRERLLLAKYLLICLELNSLPGKHVAHPWVDYVWQLPPPKRLAFLKLTVQSYGLPHK